MTVGDQLLLRTVVTDSGLHGLLCGDAAFDRVGVQQQPDKLRTALNAEDYVFRVCPMLNYRQRHELEIAEAAKGSGSNDKEARALNLLKSRVAAEEEHNAQVMESVMGSTYNGGSASVIKYGDVIQLQHVSTGGFVSTLESAAPCDPECRGVELNQAGSR
jgi:hypothetical protein